MTDAPSPSAPLVTPRRAAVAAALALLAAWLVGSRLQAPAPRAGPAPTEAFGVARARAVLDRLLAEQVPHPVGSAANRVVRERVEQELRALGLEPQLQVAPAVSRTFGQVARVENVLARLPGREPGPAILLCCHYDSVPAGPGASDDGVGVAATLEVVRALRAGPPLRRPVIVLIDDGEEAGLLGARAFVAHPWFQEVAAVVNLEARGTCGPSLMFQTSGSELAPGSPDEGRLIPLLARDSSPVFSSSVYTTVYELLPNDTDMSIFIREGRSGFNFAFIDGLPRYHTPRDDLAHASDASLQHHGDHALSLVRALADGDWDRQPPGEKLVYTDLLGVVIVSWPRSWALPVSLLALLVVLGAASVLVWRGTLRPAAWAWGVLAALLALALAGLAGPALAWILRLRGPAPWTAHPGFALFAFRAGGLALAALPLAALSRKAGAWGLWAGSWTWVGIGGVACTPLPGFSYLFVLPAGVAGLAALTVGLRDRGARPAWALAAWGASALAAGLLWIPLAIGLAKVGLLTEVTAALAAALALQALTPFLALPDRARWAPPALAALAALAALGLSLVLPSYSPARPEPLSITFHQTAAGEARWLLGGEGPPPAALREALPGLGAQPERPFPWALGRHLARVAPAQPTPLAPPELEVLGQEPQGQRRRVRVRLRSSRGARVLRLLIDPQVDPGSVELEGLTLPPHPAWLRRTMGGWSHYACLGAPPEGVEMSLDLPQGPVRLVVLDQSEGLPPTGQALQEARPDWAVPRQDGDTTVLSRELVLP